MKFKARNRELDVTDSVVMGILNVTPDSFSDGSANKNIDVIFAKAEKMVRDGASIIDVGGESTRPGWKQISVQEEIDRVVPIIEKISTSLDVMISIDTYKTPVMQAALDAGTHLLNDINGFRDIDAVDVAIKSEAAICVMHMANNIEHMHDVNEEADVVNMVSNFFKTKVQQLLEMGVNEASIILDPGYGFGMSHTQNLCLLKNLSKIYGVEKFPMLVGLSRKRMIGEITGRDVLSRMPGSVAAAVFAVMNGAKIVRVHDVAETVDALKVIKSISNAALVK